MADMKGTRNMKMHMYLVLAIAALGITTKGELPKALQYNLIDNLPPIYINPASETIGCTWSNGLVYEKPLIQKFYSLLPTDQPFVVFDLGAQTGSFSLMAKYFPLSTWHAFEPIKEATDILESNLVLNDIHNVAVHQVAVADFLGTITLRMPSRSLWGLSTIGSNLLRFKRHTKREVECIDLDTFVERHHIDRVHFMKLDTEGSELAILRGARKMIARDHPIMIMEYNETNMKQCNVLKKDIDDFLSQMGYIWKLISGEDILCIPAPIF
jgi:FkbM family methyltransferase